MRVFINRDDRYSRLLTSNQFRVYYYFTQAKTYFKDYFKAIFLKKKTIQSMQPDTKTQKYDRQLRLWQAHGRAN